MPSTSGTVEVSTGRLVLREPPLTDDELDCWKYQVGQKGGVGNCETWIVGGQHEHLARGPFSNTTYKMDTQ